MRLIYGYDEEMLMDALMNDELYSEENAYGRELLNQIKNKFDDGNAKDLMEYADHCAEQEYLACCVAFMEGIRWMWKLMQDISEFKR